MVVLAKHGLKGKGEEGQEGQEAYVTAIESEWRERVSAISPKQRAELGPLQGIYVGGGTPSLLPAAMYQRWFEMIAADWPLAPEAEITLEANPNAWTDKPEAYLKAGFNRLSMGVQSLNDTELKALSRIHTADEAEATVWQCQQAGFSNISVDVMYGIPQQTEASWTDTLERLMSLPVQHISMYGLQVEEATPLHRLVHMGAYPLPTEDEHVAMHVAGVQRLARDGFKQYEISNFAQKGYESRHNINYWRQGDYLALGPGAHGYVHPTRYANSRKLAAWIKDPCGSSESLSISDTERLENILIFGLRETAGVDGAQVHDQFGVDVFQHFESVITPLIQAGYLTWVSDKKKGAGPKRLVLPPQYVPVSNSILAEFMAD